MHPLTKIIDTQPRKRERGIAIVTVLLVVALAATLAASVLWRQRVATRDVENQRLAAETMWVERAAVEWARATLRAQSSTSNVTFDGQEWSAPVSDIQLSNLLPRDAIEVNGELANAWISGQVEDAQAKFNLANLVSRPAPAQPWRIDGNGIAAYRRLLGELSLDPALAQATADYMLRSLRDGSGTSDWPLQLVSAADLRRIPGYDAAAVHALTPFVTVLPDLTAVNVNTAPEQTIVAAIPGISAGQAHTIVQRRNTAYFVSTAEVAMLLSPPQQATATLADGAQIDVNSGYFIVHCRIHSKRINTRIDTLIARYGIGDYSWTSVIWVHRVTT
ncbi:type II secretion system minor pseudopilin GspK [Paraburkholderia humisilvae]|uniref:Type II secretion system protein K n=1 Tax=Paraburkholderia humisilvae TaxID=627669 RepID=A0A6J5D748_9BURK|nr:type II secretion system minor pseudopilin GspK [Paraburkholderia humisilvae]CAB3749201.1 Type II secretion system protein K [Paraburkholderia humisilvae]